jgi:CheY-like chemotaxis protein
MHDEKKIQRMVSSFVEEYHKSVVRAWTSFINKPLFMKGSDVRSLSAGQMGAEFQRDVGYIRIDVTGDITAAFYWFFDFRQLLLLSASMLKEGKADLKRSVKEISHEEVKALEAMAHHGALAMARSQVHKYGIKIELKNTSLHFLEESQFQELDEIIPLGLCRVVNSHFEVFGEEPSTLLTVFTDEFTLQLKKLFEDRGIRDFSLSKSSEEENTAKVMIADGVIGYRTILRRYLQPLDIKIFEVIDGKTAMSMVDSENLDLVFYDMNMSDMDGEQFARWLRRRPLSRGLPLIFCGSQVSTEVLIAGAHAGMNDFLLRPPQEEKVRQIIEKYLPELIF